MGDRLKDRVAVVTGAAQGNGRAFSEAFAEEGAIVEVLRAQTTARESRSAEAYRATMDGFYCDWADELARQQVAAVTTGGTPEHIEVESVRPVDTRNFPEARARILSTDASGISSERTVVLERFPAGWRMTWDPRWSS